MTTHDTHRAIDAIWKIESPRLIATVARMVRDLDLAEELAQDALVSALEQWPRDGVPRNPGAWLTQAAKHRAVTASVASAWPAGSSKHWARTWKACSSRTTKS